MNIRELTYVPRPERRPEEHMDPYVPRLGSEPKEHMHPFFFMRFLPFRFQSPVASVWKVFLSRALRPSLSFTCAPQRWSGLLNWFYDTSTDAAIGAAHCGSFVREDFCLLVVSYG
jgi:hypothetical protein